MGWYVASLWLLPSTGLVPVDLSMCCAGGVSVCAQLVLLLLPAVLLPLFFDAACPGLELLCSSGFQLYCSWSLRLQAHGIRPKAAEGIMGTEFLQAIKVEVRYELKPKVIWINWSPPPPAGILIAWPTSDGTLWPCWALWIHVGFLVSYYCSCGEYPVFHLLLWAGVHTVHVNSLLSAGLCFQLVFSCSLRFVLRVSPLNAVGSGLKGTAHVTAHGTAPVNSVNARSRIGNCNRLSKPGIGCPCGGEFAADDCWLDGYHEDSAPRPSY
ncbi:unnamed protein product [Ilex paraguariensis]|uniref:Uncharacterized protein n=1 Tax=Ilex paraguariensis TaxID=185542 RepID=A0ABC8TSA4_9AQUA